MLGIKQGWFQGGNCQETTMPDDGCVKGKEGPLVRLGSTNWCPLCLQFQLQWVI